MRKLLKVTVAGLLGLAAVALASGTEGVRAEDKKDTPTIKEIMKKGHAKTDGYIDKIKEAAKDGKWDDAKEYAKTLAFFGENLGKNKPTVGDEKSWEKLTKKYAEGTKTVLKAVEDKDAAAVAKALDQKGGVINCGECHNAHREKKKKN